MPQRPHHQDVFVNAERATARRPRRHRILLVDGDVGNRTLLADALTGQGLTVDEASDAHDAMAIAVVAPPDVIVYSLGWGAGLHQLDEIQAAVGDLERLPAIVLTTPVWMRARRGITLRGPVGIGELVTAIGHALTMRRPGSRA